MTLFYVAGGKYAFFIPFFNGVFSGKIARVKVDLPTTASLASDVQTLNLAQGIVKKFSDQDKLKGYRDGVQGNHTPNTYIGFRGGITSMWPSVCAEDPQLLRPPKPLIEEYSDIDSQGGFLCTRSHFYTNGKWVLKPLEMRGI